MPDVDGPLALLVLPPWGWMLAGLLGRAVGQLLQRRHPSPRAVRVGGAAGLALPALRSTPIAWHDNLPIFGWLLLGGKCRQLPRCRSPSAIRSSSCSRRCSGARRLLRASSPARDGEPVAPLLAHFLVYFAFVGTLLVLAGDRSRPQDHPRHHHLSRRSRFSSCCALLLRDVPPLDLLIGMVIGYGIVAVTAELGLSGCSSARAWATATPSC